MYLMVGSYPQIHLIVFFIFYFTTIFNQMLNKKPVKKSGSRMILTWNMYQILNINLKIQEKINSKIMMQFLKLYLMFPLFNKLKTCIWHPVLHFDRILCDFLDFTITIIFLAFEKKRTRKCKALIFYHNVTGRTCWQLQTWR